MLSRETSVSSNLVSYGKGKPARFVETVILCEEFRGNIRGHQAYRPFNKANNEINYIHKQSNHPPSIIKQLPLSVERRLSKLSSNEKIFNDSIPIYQEALIKAGYNHKLTYQKHDQKKDNPQQRKRQIIWFNPPYSKNVTTKVGKFFLSLIDKHFPPHHKLHKLFNLNNVKISYSCLPNIKSLINGYNKKNSIPVSNYWQKNLQLHQYITMSPTAKVSQQQHFIPSKHYPIRRELRNQSLLWYLQNNI